MDKFKLKGENFIIMTVQVSKGFSEKDEKSQREILYSKLPEPLFECILGDIMGRPLVT